MQERLDVAGVAALGDLRAGRDRAVEPEASGERLDEIGERGRDDDRSLAARLMRPHARDRVGKCERRQRVDLLGDERAQFVTGQPRMSLNVCAATLESSVELTPRTR